MAELTCKELVELVTAYFDGALPSDERARFERHLAGCGGCTVYVEQMRQTITLVGGLREQDVSPEAERSLLHAFRDWKGGKRDA
jgi:anti-sigma factor RsiW